MHTTYLKAICTQLLRGNLASSASSNSDDMLENWQNRMHAVYFRKCILITQYLCHVATEMIEFLVYERLPEFSAFLTVFEERVSEPQ